jgi:dTDP-4-amino-4,6-dideoxygalactose transaminase
VASGEGGICLTNDDELADRLYRLKHIGYGRGARQGEVLGGPPPGLTCHNFRGTAFQAVILRDQLEDLEARIARYERAAGRIAERLAGVSGVRIQARGRHASPQGYYGLIFIFDEGPLAEVPSARVREALKAEGLETGGTYGPVYSHMLYNMDASQYRIEGGACPVAENAASARAVYLAHPWLGSDDATVEAIGEIAAKVATHGEELRADAARG